MHAVGVAFVALAAAASSAASSIHARHPGLFARQLDPSTYPPQCQSTCTTVLDAIDACTTYACMCTTSNDQQLAVCVDCILGSDGTTPTASLSAEAQSVLTNFVTNCADAGISLPAYSATPSYVSGATSATGASSIASIGLPTSSVQITYVGTTSSSSSHTTPVAVLTSVAAGSGSGTGTAAAESSTSTDVNPFAKSGAGRVGAGVSAGVAVVGMVLGGLAVLG